MADVGFAPVQLCCLFWVDIKAKDFEAFLGKPNTQGQADVAEADDADDGGAVMDALEELLFGVHLVIGVIAARARLPQEQGHRREGVPPISYITALVMTAASDCPGWHCGW